MNIKQALKYKNKLASKMNEEFEKANRYNSVEEGNVRPYSAFEALNKATIALFMAANTQNILHANSVKDCHNYLKDFQFVHF